MSSVFEWVPRQGLSRLIDAAELGRIPDPLLRWGIRRLCSQRSKAEAQRGTTAREFAERMASSPVATHTDSANEQHYEAPTDLFRQVLGPYLKYSACVFTEEGSTLAEAERDTLALTCERGELEDGMHVLDLGCGWGSLTRYIAQHYPHCRITAISNSTTQAAWIREVCDQPGWAPVEVITADVASYDLGEQAFDRVFSVEMFEHMRNWGVLFDRIAGALKPNGLFFMHVFCHHSHPYLFEDEGEPDWMARNFFSGGIMPAFGLPREIKSQLEATGEWKVNGTHYARTLRAWLDNLDAIRPEIDSIFTRDLGEREGRRAVQRWRMFFMACEELFAAKGGTEWFVGHYALRPAPRAGVESR